MAGKGHSPVVTAAVAAVALAAGAVGGALFERGRAPAARDVAPAASQAPAESPASPAAADPQAATPAVPGPSASPEPELAASRAEIARLRQRVTDLEALVPKEKSKEDRIALAKEMVECIRRGKKDTEAFRRMLSLLNELCPEMGPYFLERSADPEEKAERSTLFVLAMSAGGPEVAEEVLRRLTGSDEDQRLQTLNVLGGGAREVFSIRNLPVSGPLANLGLQYASTGNDAERRAAAGLLGGVDSIESRTALYRMAATDSETAVKEQAVRSLGQVGDRETLAWLDSYQPSLEGLRDWEKQRLQASIDGAREQLKKKYP